MSDINDDALGLDDEGGDGGSAPKALRDQVKKLNKELAELREQNQKDREQLRARDLADALEKHGAPKRLGKYAARDITDVSDDAVLEWLKENGEDFGWTPDEGTGEDDETERQAERVSRATNDAPTQRPTSDQELLHLLRTADPKTLIEKGYIAPLQ